LEKFAQKLRFTMSKRKAPQGDNPNKDICDMLMGKYFTV
jgi:hypothetical protein